MTLRIATYSNSTGLLNQAMRLQGSYSQAQLQSASGLKSQDFTGISTEAQSLLSLNGQLTTINTQATVIASAQNRINNFYSTMDSMTTALNQANSFLTQALGSADVASLGANVPQQALSVLEQMQSLLNTQVAGRYLYGGNIQDRAPVDINAAGYNPAPTPAVPDTNYYFGDAGIESVRASNTLRIDYGITADNSAFEQAMRGLKIAIANPTSQVSLGQAHDLVKSSIKAIADINGSLTSKSAQLEAELKYQTTALDYLEQNVSTLRDADVAEATVRASQIETQLQASYGSLAKLLQLRLSDYLK